jgi:hypothetical protein
MGINQYLPNQPWGQVNVVSTITSGPFAGTIVDGPASLMASSPNAWRRPTGSLMSERWGGTIGSLLALPGWLARAPGYYCQERTCEMWLYVYPLPYRMYHAILNISDCDNKAWAFEGMPENGKDPWGRLMTIRHNENVEKREGREMLKPSGMENARFSCEECDCLKKVIAGGTNPFKPNGKDVDYAPLAEPSVNSNSVLGWAVRQCKLDDRIDPKKLKVGREQVNLPGWRTFWGGK